MSPRTTTSGRAAHARRRPPSGVRRPGLLLAAAAAGAVVVNVLVGTEPAVRAGAEATEPISVAAQLGASAPSIAADETPDLQPLEELAASRSSREAAQTSAQQAQAAADQAIRDRQQADAEAARIAAEAAEAARVAAEAAAADRAAAAAATRAAAAGEAAVAPGETGESPARSGAAPASAVARISNSSGNVRPQVQAAANAVVSGVPGAAGITIGGTRASAADPGGHPSGLALDYMVPVGSALGDAIVQYHVDHWDELGVEYLIWEQRMLSSPGGSWRRMEDRGSTTANHYDHVHVNHLG